MKVHLSYNLEMCATMREASHVSVHFYFQVSAGAKGAVSGRRCVWEGSSLWERETAAVMCSEAEPPEAKPMNGNLYLFWMALKACRKHCIIA